MTTRIKRRKTARKEAVIPVRLTIEQKATLVTAAEQRGLGVSTWLLTLGLAEASKDEEDKKAAPKVGKSVAG